MTAADDLDIFLVVPPGLERFLFAEARENGFASARYVPGGVTLKGGWPDVWRANLVLRGAVRVIVKLGDFRALHLSELDKRARRFRWSDTLRRGSAVRVEAACSRSKIYHSGAVAERIGRAIHETLGAPIADDAAVTVRARFEDDVCTISIDSSGEMLHRRGHKQAVNKAPMRETMAALFLRQCGYTGAEPVVDPMCGSGTFVIEAAEIASGLLPGRSRAFAFEQLATFDSAAWRRVRDAASKHTPSTISHFGSDRDSGAIAMCRDNAARAGVGDCTRFEHHSISDLKAPPGPAGLVIVNPPYGDRIGDRQKLHGLYRSFGQKMLSEFSGWRTAIITTDPALAKATGLPFEPPGAPVAHGGLRVTLYQTACLP